MLKIKIITFLIICTKLYSQNLIVNYEFTSYKGKLKNDVTLYINDSISQFICNFEKKKFTFGEYEAEQHEKYYINNFYFKTKKSIEITNYKTNKLYSEWNYDFSWTITDEEDKIIGYKVKKAFLETNSKAGKVYVWFTTDIPYSAGPFRYNGLPGLILKIHYEKINTNIIVKNIIESNKMEFKTIDTLNAIKIDKETIINYDENVLEEKIKNYKIKKNE